MKHVLLISALGLAAISGTAPQTKSENKTFPVDLNAANMKAGRLNFGSQQPGNEKMMAAVFRAQDFCYIELKDFEWDVKFDVVSATVYFSGANFSKVEKGTITSKSLQPIKKYMDRCVPGSMVIFDNVQVKGPDNTIRSIRGLSLVLH